MLIYNFYSIFTILLEIRHFPHPSLTSGGGGGWRVRYLVCVRILLLSQYGPRSNMVHGVIRFTAYIIFSS